MYINQSMSTIDLARKLKSNFGNINKHKGDFFVWKKVKGRKAIANLEFLTKQTWQTS